jgi:hypothetical protein
MASHNSRLAGMRNCPLKLLTKYDIKKKEKNMPLFHITKDKLGRGQCYDCPITCPKRQKQRDVRRNGANYLKISIDIKQLSV